MERASPETTLISYYCNELEGQSERFQQGVRSPRHFHLLLPTYSFLFPSSIGISSSAGSAFLFYIWAKLTSFSKLHFIDLTIAHFYPLLSPLATLLLSHILNHLSELPIVSYGCCDSGKECL